MSPMRLATRSLSWRIALTVFAMNVLYVNSYLGNPMSKSMLDLTVSLVDRGKLNIDPYGYNSTDISKHNGHLYSGMPPGVSLVCVPYYLLAKTWLWLVATRELDRVIDNRYFGGPTSVAYQGKHSTIILLNLFICVFGCSVMAGAMAVLFHHALTILYPGLEERRRLVTTWLFSFGTVWFIYSPAIYHRVFSTFLCFGAFLLVLLPEQRRPALRWRGLLFGLGLGLAIASTYESAIVAAVLVVYALARRGRRWSWGWTTVGVAFFLVMLAAYHTACFGSPWTTPYEMRIEGSVVPPLLREGTSPRTPGPWWIGNLLLGARYGVILYPLQRLFDFLLGSRYGVFFYSPLLLLGLPALARLRRGNCYDGPAAVAFGILASLFIFHYVTGYDGLPGEFGFRMMLPAIPFLMLLVPLTYGWSYRYVVPVLAGLSAVIVGKGVLFGIHAGRPFWSNYLDLIAAYGFSNYTLANLKDHVWPDFPAWAISAIHLAALAVIALFLWRFVWRAKTAGNGHTTV